MAATNSVAVNHFPQIVWRDEKKHLWNPIHRQALKNLPEERVRLRIVEYLMHGGWSKHRISTEESLPVPPDAPPLRTDIICYTNDITPFLLVECKAPAITLSAKTAEQIARYNQHVEAPFLLMTNGQRDFWYDLRNNDLEKPLNAIPEALPAVNRPKLNFDYWQSRGFAGHSAASDIRKWLNKTLPTFYLDSKSGELRHLSFKKSPSDLDLNNYYRLFAGDSHRLALSFTATAFGGSRLIAILNTGGENRAVLEINFDLVFDDRVPNASVYHAGGIENIDITKWVSEITNPIHTPQPFADDIRTLLERTLE